MKMINDIYVLGEFKVLANGHTMVKEREREMWKISFIIILYILVVTEDSSTECRSIGTSYH